MRTVEASRCTLEPLVVAHAQEMFSVLSDPAIYEFENEPPPSRSWLAEVMRGLSVAPRVPESFSAGHDRSRLSKEAGTRIPISHAAGSRTTSAVSVVMMAITDTLGSTKL
jgi:hypothetical protein